MIRTVLGDIVPTRGPILMHEHIQCVSNDMLHTFGQAWLGESEMEDYAVRILTALREESGLSVFVDGTPLDLGRNIPLLQRISRRSGIHIIASTGLYYYPSCLSSTRTPEELAALFLRECASGMESTTARPGILKCAANGDPLSADERKRLCALAIAQKESGLALYAHSSHRGENSPQMLQTLLDAGADPTKTVIGHCGLRPDPEYLTALLQSGCSISIDQCFSRQLTANAKTVAELCRRGYSDRIVCSLDHPIYNEFRYGTQTGINWPASAHVDAYAYLFREMIPAFRQAGCTEEQCRAFLEANPLRLLSIEYA